MTDRGLRRVAVIGGGPGGLYTARLLKLARPDWEVQVHDQFPPKDTFGFGVGLSLSTQRNLAQSDPDTLADIVQASYRGHGAQLHTPNGVARLGGQETLAIARSTLLQILSDHAEASGVQLHIGRINDHRDVDADVVVAADGVGSVTRRALADELGETIQYGRQYYLWCGTDFALTDGLFAPVMTDYGVFTCHAYPYAADRSTFLVETDEKTWRAAGFAETSAATASDESDLVAVRYLEEIFGEHLRGHRLLDNRSRWTRFRTVRCDRWHTGNVVLIGDAAHTAHYSVGSGTKLAMEDAIALTGALTSAPIDDAADLSRAFDAYQVRRMPGVDRLQQLADRSHLWWESYPRRLHFTPERLAMSFISRAGNVALDAFAATTPELARPALIEFGDGAEPPQDSIAEWVLTQPLEHPRLRHTGRIVDEELPFTTIDVDIDDTWGPDADAVVARCAALLDDGADGVRLTGPESRAAVLHRLDLAERIHLDLADRKPLTVVDAPAQLISDLAAGLVSGRTDLISLQG